MPDFNGKSRSNYVRIADMAGLEAALEPFGNEIEIVTHGSEPNCVMFEGTEGGMMPGSVTDHDGNDIEFDPATHICPFMKEGQVLVLMGAGSENLRYISGHAEAYAWDGRYTGFNLNKIYEMAAKEFGIEQSHIAEASYENVSDGVPVADRPRDKG